MIETPAVAEDSGCLLVAWAVPDMGRLFFQLVKSSCKMGKDIFGLFLESFKQHCHLPSPQKPFYQQIQMKFEHKPSCFECSDAQACFE